LYFLELPPAAAEFAALLHVLANIEYT
jgi:hypothetical protein